MTISINTSTSSQIASQDLASNPGAQTGVKAGGEPPANASPEQETAPSQADLVTAHAGLVALAKGGAASGVADHVNPDLDAEGARLQALQLQQQLGAQNAPIANQAPQALLALLR